ncbi:redoxin domain-containing protein [Pelagicoccus sp. SDUM812005]|uniref:redoxin domain-containing protein n=1 Tax=Pelagicoccus sp. SDUM812005 TaxID=3041257 RepID=UPI00280E092E|nr:redoxin domain-containing protein [Pelagicoccus sp. SDUM812005]MDQ8179578.1 redoxin domain-containing protein [Pelagicoccus sp. SDUM812005]
MNTLFRALLALSLFNLIPTLTIAAEDGPEGLQTLEIGDKAPDFTLPGIDGRDYSLSDFAGPDILMVFFTSNHCPTSHAVEGRLQAMLEKIEREKRSFAFVAINPNHPEGMTPAELGFGKYTDSFEDMIPYAKEAGWTFPYLYDGDTQSTARAYGCLATPHVFIFDRHRTLQYKGRFDDSRIPDPASVKSPDALNALDALFAGEPVPVPVTKPHGCSTKWREKKAKVRVAQERFEKSASVVELDTLDAVGAAALRANGTDKYRMINLWATWCAPCVEEFPDLVSIQRQLGLRPFELITISLDEPKNEKRVQAFLERKYAGTPPKLKRIAVSEGRKSNNYLYTGSGQDELAAAIDPDWPGPLPHTVIVDPKGNIIYRHNGVIDREEAISVLIENLTPYWPSNPSS